MNKIENGQRFGRLVVLCEGTRLSKRRWDCRCDCGSGKTVFGFSLMSGQTKSCGCLARELSSARNTTHGHCSNTNGKSTREYTAWRRMLSRCSNNAHPTNVIYYLNRGIRVCQRWQKFENFLADIGKHPGKGFSLDRINNNGNYEPGNCRWADAATQIKNRRKHGLIEAFTEEELEQELERRRSKQLCAS